MTNSDRNIAYLRDYDSRYCDILFRLDIKTVNGDFVSQEIIGTAKCDDTLGILSKSIQENIIKLNENDAEKENNLFKLPTDPNELEVLFTKQEKPFKDNLVLQNFIKLPDDKFIQVLGKKFSIVINAPLVRAVYLPSSITANFPVEPAAIKSHNLHKGTTKFIWSKSADQKVWEKVGEGYEYHVKESDVDHYLKFCVVPYSIYKVKGPIVETISNYKVGIITEFPKCPFEERHAFTSQKLTGNKFRIVSYNLLSQRYFTEAQFPYCPPHAMAVHYRKQLILKELEGYNADIICLQEVDDKQYKSYYKKELKERGYRSFFKRKGHCLSEGLLSAFIEQRYKLLDSKHVVLRMAIDRTQFKNVADLLDLNEEVRTEFMKQNTSLQSVVLQDNRTKQIVIVGNTHLYYHPDADHIRLLQGFMATLHLSTMKHRIMREYHTKHVAVIFCGDFNSDFTKSLYNFMITGTIKGKHEDCVKISPTRKVSISHKLNFINASGTPKYTNYTRDFKGCLDYIFVQSSKISVSKVIDVPKAQELEKYEGLPNEFYPSDHLALVVELQFNK